MAKIIIEFAIKTIIFPGILNAMRVRLGISRGWEAFLNHFAHMYLLKQLF